jgi:hypothetical protein
MGSGFDGHLGLESGRDRTKHYIDLVNELLSKSSAITYKT